jgi:hypothetical protein
MKPGNHPGCDVDGECEPRPSDGLTVLPIYDDHINQGVIYLNHLQRGMWL